MGSKVNLNHLYVIDLTLVSLWALFALTAENSMNIFVLPLFIIRLASVFCLKLRERKSWILILVFALGAAYTLKFPDYVFDDFILCPFARMYDDIVMLVTGQSTLLEGAYHHLGDYGDLVPVPGKSWPIFAVCYIIWLVFVPIAIYFYLLLKKELRPSHWNWGKILGVIIAYIVLNGCSLLIYNLGHAILPGFGLKWWLVVMAIPLITNIRWQNLSSWCRHYIALASLFIIATTAGIYMQSTASLIAISVSVPLFYVFIANRRGMGHIAGFHHNVYLLFLSGVTFWAAQYTMDITRVILLITSAVLCGIVAYRMWLPSRNILPSATVLIVCAFVLPSISLGYNQYNCLAAKRLFSYTNYSYSYRGLLKVNDSAGLALRDRYGYITPRGLEKIESLGDSSKPYIKVRRDDGWGIYDLERQEFVVAPDASISNILPYDKNVWKLMNKNGNGYGYDRFFVGPSYYSRYKERGTESDCPFENRLAENLPLRYDYRISDAESLDYLLEELMTPLWEKPDSIPYADFYWEWAEGVSATIDRLHEERGMFFTYDGLYIDAMNYLEKYIDPSCGGSQREMNAHSYVFAAIANYRMIQAVQELADSLPNVDIRREYQLFSDFMTAYENWETKCNEGREWYSDRPREDNEEAANRFQDRHASINDMLAVVRGDTILPPTAPTSQASINRYFKHLSTSCTGEAKDLVAPIKTGFKEWIDFRNELATQLPPPLASSYRNQTRQLKNKYTSSHRHNPLPE